MGGIHHYKPPQCLTADRTPALLSTRVQLHNAESAAQPGARYRGDDERDRIPVRPEGWSLVPRQQGTGSARDKAHDTKRQGVRHWPIGGKPGGDVAPRDTVDGALNCCQQQQRIAYPLTPRGKDSG